jgi:hypothetical protein
MAPVALRRVAVTRAPGRGNSYKAAEQFTGPAGLRPQAVNDATGDRRGMETAFRLARTGTLTMRKFALLAPDALRGD